MRSRLYLVTQGSELHRVAYKGFGEGLKPYAQFASSRQRVIWVTMRYDGTEMHGGYIELDAGGFYDRRKAQLQAGRAYGHMISSIRAKAEEVVNLGPVRERRQFDAQETWQPSERQINSIACDLLTTDHPDYRYLPILKSETREANVVITGLYACHICGAGGCKLWRQRHSAKLLCVRCAADDCIGPLENLSDLDADGVHSDLNGRTTDQVGWCVPAIPADDGIYWGYPALPEEAYAEWRRLPSWPSKKAAGPTAVRPL